MTFFAYNSSEASTITENIRARVADIRSRLPVGTSTGKSNWYGWLLTLSRFKIFPKRKDFFPFA